MKVGLIVLAVVMVLIGAVWIGQGLGYIKGSVMTGSMLWFWIGIAVGIAGLVLGAVTLTFSRGRATRG